MKKNIYLEQEKFLHTLLAGTQPEIISAVLEKWNDDYETILYSAFKSYGFVFRTVYFGKYTRREPFMNAVSLAWNCLINQIAFDSVKDVCGLRSCETESEVKNAMMELLKHIFLPETVWSLFKMYEKLSNGGIDTVEARPPASHRKKVIFRDPLLTFKRITVLNDISAAELGRRLHSTRSRQHFADVEYGYEKPSVFEIAMLCLTFGEKLSDWRRAAPDVDYIIRRYEYNGLNCIDDFMAQLADKYELSVSQPDWGIESYVDKW